LYEKIKTPKVSKDESSFTPKVHEKVKTHASSVNEKIPEQTTLPAGEKGTFSSQRQTASGALYTTHHEGNLRVMIFYPRFYWNQDGLTSIN
jgi:hypothetical protein